MQESSVPLTILDRMRSKLFVPGSRPELFAKALAGEADAISIDLEDAVLESRKSEAREHTTKFLRSAELQASGKVAIVRVNSPRTPHFEADVCAIALPSLAFLNLPKVESVEDIRLAVLGLERAEAANGVTKPLPILANIETANGLRLAHEIAVAHSRVAGLQLGFADLFGSLGIDRHDAASVHAVMFSVRIAAGAAGVFAYDGAFPDVKDLTGFRAEAEVSRRLGYWGKSCIHPAQVAVANEVYRPSKEEIAHALKVMEAVRRAEQQGAGAFLVDGKMIDAPAIRRAEAIAAMSARAGRG